MARSAPTLDRLPLVDEETGDFTIVLETPKGSRNKYAYDAECHTIRLSATLGEAWPFPTISVSSRRPWARTAIRSTCCCSSTPPCRRARRHGAPDRRARGRTEGQGQAMAAQRPLLRGGDACAHPSGAQEARRSAAPPAAGNLILLHPLCRAERQAAAHRAAERAAAGAQAPEGGCQGVQGQALKRLPCWSPVRF